MPTDRDLLHAYLLDDPKGAVTIIQAQKSDEAKDKDLKDILGFDQAKMDDLYTRHFQLPAGTSQARRLSGSSGQGAGGGIARGV